MAIMRRHPCRRDDSFYQRLKANAQLYSTVEAIAPSKLYSMRREEPRSCNQDSRPACSVRRIDKRFAGDNVYRFDWG